MSKNPLPHIDKPDEETIDKMKSSDYSKNQKVQDEILKFLEKLVGCSIPTMMLSTKY